MKVLQINTTLNAGSTGRIAESIGLKVISKGGRSIIAYGRNPQGSQSLTYKVGGKISIFNHVFESRIFDNHGLASRLATHKLVNFIKEQSPDVIHLHNIHGYYLNYRILFRYLRRTTIPVVWTLHDCWLLTGHCTHFDYSGCDKWKTGCSAACPEKKIYPASYLKDASERNFKLKKELFTQLNNLTLVPVSRWLSDVVNNSFFRNTTTAIRQIHNGIDLDVFKPSLSSVKNDFGIEGKRIILGVCNGWSDRKGFSDFLQLAEIIDDGMIIVMIGVSKKEIEQLPSNIIGVELTSSIEELVMWYSASDVLFNPTYEDNYPTINLEAIASGTPVITYNTGGSPESLTPETGFVVDKGNYTQVLSILADLKARDKNKTVEMCRAHALSCFDMNKAFDLYLKLYRDLLKK